MFIAEWGVDVELGVWSEGLPGLCWCWCGGALGR